MTTLNSEVHDTLTERGTSVAAYNNRFTKPEYNMNLLCWMVGTNLAVSAGILVKLFVR